MMIDMPKIEAPFLREVINNKRVVIDKINPGYEWVFHDEGVIAVEKLHGTNTSILIKNGTITDVFNRKTKVPFFSIPKRFINDAIMNSYERGFLQLLPDGQHFGEVIGKKLHGNPYQLDCHLWLPFQTYCRKNLKFKSWGKYPKDFTSISEWFKNLLPLFSLSQGLTNGFVEGVVFIHSSGKMAKLRKDMFDWYKGKTYHK